MTDPGIPRLVDPVAAPRHYSKPSARELRRQSVHRLQIGLFGLCSMLLLVGLANIIMDRAVLPEEKDAATEEIIAVDAKPQKSASDPLADIGVVPSANPAPKNGAKPAAQQEPSAPQ